jgi:signal transduction histidine kinase
MHVDDHGVGVPEAERERIFERFHRSGDESTRSAPGTGLGLHLVRSTVEAMNGWVRVEDNPEGVGSRFTVTLPRRVVAASEPAEAGRAAAGEATS